MSAPKLTFAEQKAKAAATAETMQARIADGLVTGADWVKHLDLISKLHGYSPRNRALLAWQWWERQIATEGVRAFETWVYGAPVTPSLGDLGAVAAGSKWKDMGGMIRKGEKALSVLAPVIIKDKANPRPDGTIPEKRIGWKLINRSFSVAQIEGVEIPEPVKLLEGEGPEGAWESLVALATEIGYTVEQVPVIIESTTANGMVTWSTKEIKIRSTNSPAQQVKTLIHEIAHALLHADMGYLPTVVKEVEAESTAYIVSQNLDFNTEDYSLGYVGHWSGGNAELIRSTIERVSDTAARITTWMETGELPAARKVGTDLAAMFGDLVAA